MKDPLQYWESKLNELEIVEESDETFEYLCVLINALYYAVLYDTDASCMHIYAVLLETWSMLRSDQTAGYVAACDKSQPVKLGFYLRNCI